MAVHSVKSAIRKVAVLGAGTMGAQVAAHLAGQGLEVVLLDLAQPGPEKSALSRQAIAGLARLKPSPWHLAEHAQLVRSGNFDDDWRELADADWVFEAVVEDLDVKRRLFERAAPAVQQTALVTTNTSGLSLMRLGAGLPGEVRRRFFGTHFFNPPRYLKLLELIAGPDTDAEALARFEEFAEATLGKAVVRCKDTPGFIANRIGAYGFGCVLSAMRELDLSIEEVDALTGPAIGRPKSASFRTADIAGVDVCARVAAHLFEALPDDPERGAFAVPDFMAAMLERKWLGEKAAAGFYRREGREIRVLDWKTLEYRERRKPSLPALEAAGSPAELGARLRQILAAGDKASDFLWRVLSRTSLYAASLVPEIADHVVSIDRAMEWGYGWTLGPFRLLDALGVEAVAARARSEGRPVPPLIEGLLAGGRERFYEDACGQPTTFTHTGVRPVPERPGVVVLERLRRAGAVVKRNPGASLLDLGDGVALVEFHSKMNVLGADSFAMLHSAAKSAAAHFDALVIGNQGENFTAGANLLLALLAAQEEEWDELEQTIRQFQDANMALKYGPLPVVAAPFGLALGGGCEIALHAARVRCSAETYMGLVEVGVGLVPAGGGSKELALRALDRCAGVDGADPLPFLKRAFDLIAFARVSASGAEALRMFFTPVDSASPNPDRLIGDAKQVALGLARAGHRPARPRSDVPALGRPALATFKLGIHNARRGGHISDHDVVVATKLAGILCGGGREPGVASEQHFLDLEREAFLSLLGMPKTRERIQYTLKHGKPLRN
jgi:3-hydroxyacyl-CoA dehydrogenase